MKLSESFVNSFLKNACKHYSRLLAVSLAHITHAFTHAHANIYQFDIGCLFRHPSRCMILLRVQKATPRSQILLQQGSHCGSLTLVWLDRSMTCSNSDSDPLPALSRKTRRSAAGCDRWSTTTEQEETPEHCSPTGGCRYAFLYGNDKGSSTTSDGRSLFKKRGGRYFSPTRKHCLVCYRETETTSY